ncbi:hypothetical protein [Staphylococcus sp. 11261D007BR]
MNKFLTLSLTTVLLLSACSFNNDTNSDNDSDQNNKEEMANNNSNQNNTEETANNNSNQNNKEKTINDNNNQQANTGYQNRTTQQSKITPEQAEEIVKNNTSSAMYDIKYNAQQSTDDKIAVDFTSKGNVTPVPTQAIVDAYSGEILDYYNNETEEQKRTRAKGYLNSPLIVNKLDTPLIKEYQPKAYNKLAQYEQEHPNAFSENDGLANQRLVNQILGSGHSAAPSPNEDNDTDQETEPQADDSETQNEPETEATTSSEVASEVASPEADNTQEQSEEPAPQTQGKMEKPEPQTQKNSEATSDEATNPND